ncbi:uncharacterized protein LOC130809111 isoform X2 [Amaranthus tricolor]|uniref:uncharacterized protein LOC130809111 isoform X2 n=1 Tax=Amaranthus tricolor TaxID=29722 RepID=UPI00258A0229|nr:uncharacterized protein LOC130809111 isoform X2 [Amaranthus tricolor]
MSRTNEDVVQEVVDNKPQGQEQVSELTEEETRHADKTEENQVPSTVQQEEMIKKKYGGILPKKKPLISKDHEHAFFDSADWALGKQGGQKPKGPLDALRPKLQPTPHQQVRSRRSAYAPADGEGVSPHDEDTTPKTSSEDQDFAREDDKHEKSVSPEAQSCHE